MYIYLYASKLPTNSVGSHVTSDYTEHEGWRALILTMITTTTTTTAAAAITVIAG